MRRFLLLACWTVCILPALASPRSLKDAKLVAADFLQQVDAYAGTTAEFTQVSPEEQSKIKGLSQAAPEYYILNAEDGKGYVVVSGDDRFRDVLGYSCTGTFDADNVPEGLAALLYTLGREMKAAKDYYDANGIVSVEKKDRALAASNPTTLPLLKTHWQQGYPFNKNVPVSYSGSYSAYHGKASVGCVALAMAQVMKYWKYPQNGQGGSYTNMNYTSATVNFSNQTYNWSNIIDDYGLYVDDNGEVRDKSYTTAQANEVAKLCYHLGVSVNMEWNEDGEGSSATIEDYIVGALATYFGYNPYASLQVRDVLGEERFAQIMIDDLAAGRPIIFSAVSAEGGGHCFVIDGYDASADMFHCNWGWQGQENDYYALSAMEPDSDFGNFQYNQTAVIGLQPESENFGYEPSIYAEDITLSETTVSKGSKAKMNVKNLYYSDAMFKGEVGITISKPDGSLVASEFHDADYELGYMYTFDIYSHTIPKSMSAGEYVMRISLRNSAGTLYPLHSYYGKVESWKVVVSSGSPSGTVSFYPLDPIATAVEGIIAAESTEEDSGEWYSITGVRLAAPQKGINIRNGKKYILR